MYLGWFTGLFCVSKDDNANFVYMWANAYLSYSQPPLYYILQETLCVRGRIATQIVLQNILKFAHGYNLCARACVCVCVCVCVLLRWGRDISNLRENHKLDCRFWGYKTQNKKLNIRWDKIKAPLVVFIFITEIFHSFGLKGSGKKHVARIFKVQNVSHWNVANEMLPTNRTSNRYFIFSNEWIRIIYK